MKQIPNQILMAVLTAIVGLLVTNAWLGYENIEQMRQGSLAASRNRSIMVALENTISLVTEAESGQRGYLITGESEYLEPYRKALANIDGQIKFLEHATANNPAQRTRIPELKRRLETRIQQLQQRVEARASEGLDAARQAILLNRGKVEMDDLRQHVAEMVRIESEIRDASVQRSARNYNVALSSSLIGDAVAMLMVAAFIYLLGRHLRERKRTEAVIHEQRELFRTTISSIGDAVLTTDTDGRVKSLNRIAQSLTGWTEEAALGQDLKTVFPIVNEQTNIPAENPAARVLRGGTIVGLANHTILVARDGTRHPIDDNAAPIRDANGNVLGAVMVFRDVSERRKTEAAVQAEAHTLATLNRVGSTVAAELDLERVVQVVTDAATELCGAAFGAFFYNAIGEKGESYLLYALSGAPREAFEKFGRPRNTAVFAPTFRGEGLVRVADITQDPRYGQNWPHKGMPEGHLPVRSYLAAPVVSRSGKVIGGLFFGHPDIDVFTERSERIVAGIAAQAAIAIDNAHVYQAAQKEIEQRAHAEEALRRSEDKFRRQAEELERQLIASGRLVSVGEITASMAHEFNNPLGIILGFAEEVRSELPPGDHNHRALLIIEGETRRCQKIIQELLQFTRPTGPEPAWTNIRETVEKSLALVANHLYKQKIDLHTGFDVEFPQIYIDAKQLEQVLVNLYLNAIAAMPNGGNLWVNTKIDSPIDDAPTGVIEVKDTGSGIEPHDLPKIFEPFFTAKKRTGLGLGLSVCERIVKNHGGRIEAASQPGEGTQVTVHLPVERKAAMIDPG